MYAIYLDEINFANITFVICIFLFALSLVISLIEIMRSTKALELKLSDMVGLEKDSRVGYLKKKLDA